MAQVMPDAQEQPGHQCCSIVVIGSSTSNSACNSACGSRCNRATTSGPGSTACPLASPPRKFPHQRGAGAVSELTGDQPTRHATPGFGPACPQTKAPQDPPTAPDAAGAAPPEHRQASSGVIAGKQQASRAAASACAGRCPNAFIPTLRLPAAQTTPGPRSWGLPAAGNRADHSRRDAAQHSPPQPDVNCG